MPNRILRDGILTSPRVAKLNWAEETFYRRLHSVVDDFGRYYADHGLVRAACYPRLLNKVSDSDIEKWLTACVTAALVRVYPAEDGERYLMVLDFKQQVRATKSKFPQPTGTCVADAQQMKSNEHLGVFGVVSEGVDVSVVVSEKKSAVAPPPFELPDWINRGHWDAWHSCPKRKKATDSQKQMAVNKLDAWRTEGVDHAAALENAAIGGWQGLFKPDEIPKGTPGRFGAPSEPAWRTEQRQRTQQAAPGVAVGGANQFFEAEVKNVTPISLD